MNWRELMTVDPNVHHGKACIIDTRVMVSVLLDCREAATSQEEIFLSHSSLANEEKAAT